MALVRVMEAACQEAMVHRLVPALPIPYSHRTARGYVATGCAWLLEDADGLRRAAAVVDVDSPWDGVPAVYVCHLAALGRRRWGAVMLDRLEEWGARQGRGRLRLTVPAGNRRLERYLERLGFEGRGQAARLPGGTVHMRYERIAAGAAPVPGSAPK